MADNLQHQSAMDTRAILVKSVHIRPPTLCMLDGMRVRLQVLLLVFTASWVSCARHQRGDAEVPATPIPAEMVRFEHVFVVVEENQNYDEVIGNTQDMPYLNSLASKYGVATNYYANTHPSLN